MGKCAIPDVSESAFDQKKFATLQAKLAIGGGFVLNRLSDGSFVAHRWGLVCELPDLDAVELFVVQVTGSRK